MWHPVYAALLCLNTQITVLMVVPHSTDPFATALVFATECAALFNLWLMDLTLQSFLHDVYVCLLLYSLFSTKCNLLQQFARYLSILQIATRQIYGSCLFMWENTSRSLEVDMILVFVVMLGLRSPPLRLPAWCCAAMAVAAHQVTDLPSAHYVLDH